MFCCRRPGGDKSETQPFLSSTASTVSPTVPIHSGTSTINRTLLHHQQQQGGSATLGGHGVRNGANGGVRGFAHHNPHNVSGNGNGNGLIHGNGSLPPPPDYSVVVHESSRHGFFSSFFVFLLVSLFWVFFRLTFDSQQQQTHTHTSETSIANTHTHTIFTRNMNTFTKDIKAILITYILWFNFYIDVVRGWFHIYLHDN